MFSESSGYLNRLLLDRPLPLSTQMLARQSHYKFCIRQWSIRRDARLIKILKKLSICFLKLKKADNSYAFKIPIFTQDHYLLYFGFVDSPF